MGSCEARGRGYRTSAFLPPLSTAVVVLFPSLPAGINTDDSDPLGPDRGTVLSAAIGAGRNPRFGGGSLSSPRIFLYQHAGSRLVGTNHGKQKSLRNVGPVHPPPLSLYRKISGSKYHEKLTKNAPSNRLRKPGCPVGRIVVNRDPFHKLRRFGKFQEFHVPIRSALHPSVLAHKFLIAAVKRRPNRANLLLDRQPLDHLPWLRRCPCFKHSRRPIHGS